MVKWIVGLLAAALLVGIFVTGQWVFKQVDKKSQATVERLEKYKNRKPRNDLPHVGYLAPKIELPNLQGQVVKLSDHGDQPTLVVFFTSWSTHCQKEIEKIQKEYEAKGQKIRFLLVNDTENDTEADAIKMLELQHLDKKMVLDRKGAVSEDYGIEVYPTSFIVGTDHKVKERWTGSIDQAKWDQLLAKYEATGK